MTVTVTPTESNILTALRSFMTAILPSSVDVVRGQDNRVAEPDGSDFVVMTPIMRSRIATNTDTYLDSYPSTPQQQTLTAPWMWTVQLDFHGPSSADYSQIFTQLFRDDYAVQQFGTSGFDVTPLYCEDAKQVPYMNAQQQVERRWVIDCLLQANEAVVVSQEFADALEIGLVDVPVVYP